MTGSLGIIHIWRQIRYLNRVGGRSKIPQIHMTSWQQLWSFEDKGQLRLYFWSTIGSSRIFFWFDFHWLSNESSKIGLILENRVFKKSCSYLKILIAKPNWKSMKVKPKTYFPRSDFSANSRDLKQKPSASWPMSS